MKKAFDINSIQANDPLNFFEKSISNKRVIDIQTEQKTIQLCEKLWPGFKKNAQMILHMLHFKRNCIISTFRVCNYVKVFLALQVFDDVGNVELSSVHSETFATRRTLELATHRQVLTSELSEPLKSFVKDSTLRCSHSYSRITSKTVSFSTLKRVNKKQLSPPLKPTHRYNFFREI